jgi:hypothetical protein
MRLTKRETSFACVSCRKKGQITMQGIWMIIAIIGLVAAALILFFARDTVSNYLSKFYDCMRYGGCFK